MRIAKVEALPLRAFPANPVRMPTQTISSFVTTLVQITTDDGLVGVGECIVRNSPKITAAIITDAVTPMIMGMDPLDTEAVWWKLFQSMRGRGHTGGYFVEAISGVDMALWDIIGRYYDQPIGKILGGMHRTQVPAYASSIMLDDMDIMVRKAKELTSLGYGSIKVKVGLGKYKDIKIVSKIRDAVGPDVGIMVDANSFYCAGDAVYVGKAFEELNVIWFEEPVMPDDVDGYRLLRSKLNMKIATGESFFTSLDYRPFLENDYVDVVQPDVSRCGGFTESRKISNLAEVFHKVYAPHTGFSSSVCVFGSLQLASYAHNFDKYEYMVIDNPLQHIMDVEIPPVIDGMVEIPQTPGLGASLNEVLVQKYLER